MPKEKNTKETTGTKESNKKETKKTSKTTRKASAARTSKPAKVSTKMSAAIDDDTMDSTFQDKTFSPSASSSSVKPSFRVKKSYLVLAAILLALVVLLYFGRSWLVAAVVNGQPISRLEVVKETEKQSGKQALNNLVRNTLIEQEARKQKVVISDKEVNDQLKQVESNLKKQGQSLDQVLAMQGMNKDDLKRLIKLDLLVGKMVGKDIKISDKDVDDYIAKNKDLLPKDQTESDLKKTVRERLRQQELNAKVQTWLADLQSKAKILYFVTY